MELVVPTTNSRPTTLISSIPDHPPIIRRSKTATFPLRISISRTQPRVSRKVSSFSQPAVVAVSAAASISSCSKWMVVMERPHGGLASKSEVVDFYVETLAKVLGSEKEAQMCIYDASWQTHFGFCCDIDEEASTQLAGLPGVLSVRPDKDADSISKDYSFTGSLMGHLSKSIGRSSKFSPSLPGESSQYWLVQMEKPRVEVVTKAQIVDYYAQTLTKVLGNEKDAQVSIYSISWENEFGFCCQIDEDCAQEVAAVPGVLSVRPDMNFNSENKDYKVLGAPSPAKSTSSFVRLFEESSSWGVRNGGELWQRVDKHTHRLFNCVTVGKNLMDSSTTSYSNQTPKTKRLFVTGLSFYTSEKTLHGAFEGYGELVEVKIIMDKISKRSKGYAFIEYTTEDAASAALKEMNGKIINGWMIVVDVARTNPPRYNRAQSRPSSRHTYSN